MALTEVHRSGKRRILVVDDDPVIRAFCRKVLKQAGYTTLAAAGSSDAIWLTASSAEPFDLLVVDVFLPISTALPLGPIQNVYPPMNGDEMVRHMLGIVPELRVLYISSSSHDHLLKQGITLSPAPFLPKPLAADTLLRSVQATMEAQPLRLEHLGSEPPKPGNRCDQQFWLAS
jgi:CheY-like chemotaxis protein